MIEGQNNRNNSEINDNYRLLDSLIDSSDSVDMARLDSALKIKQITQEEYIELARKLMKRSEWIEEELINTEKKRGAQVEELEIDPVTKLFKRNLLEQKLNDLIKELNFKSNSEKKRRFPLCAVMIISIDVDNLKIWNDTYGHSVGDKALQTIANSIKEIIRDGDYIFRLGDKADEIIVTMRIEKDLKPDKLKEIFQNTKHKVSSKFIEINNLKLPVTAAMGYVILKPGESKSSEQILHAADLNQTADKAPEIKKQRIEKATLDLKKLN